MSGGLVLQTLGYVAQTKRAIKPSAQYNHLFGAPSGQLKNIKVNPSVAEILHHMQILVNNTLPQTSKFAAYLQQNNKTTESLLKALFTFMYQHIDYREDKQGFEQLREPSRLFLDKIGDCDCYSVFIKSVLQNIGLKSHFKVVKFNNSPNFSHVYVVVPKFASANLSNRNDYWVIDPVLDTFNDEAKGITGAEVASLSGTPSYFNGVPNAPIPQKQNSVTDMLFADSSLGAAKARIKLLDIEQTDNKDAEKLKQNVAIAPIKFGEGLNPFEQVIAQTFKGTRNETFAATQLAPRKKAALNGVGDLDLMNPLDPKNADALLNNPEFKEYADKASRTVKLLNKPETKAAIEKLNSLSAFIKRNNIDASASSIANSPSPIRDFSKSEIGLAGLGIVSSAATVAIANAVMIALAGAGVATGGLLPVVLIAVGAIVAAVLFLVTDNADETIKNFMDWANGKGPTIIPFDNYEGFKDDKTDVNIFGMLIRDWRKKATGSESGDLIQSPIDYFPILTSIFQNAPLKPGTSFIVNPNKLVVYTAFNNALTAYYGPEYWKQPNWMRIRAYMCTPLLAEILYGETWESFKPKLQVFFAAKNININFLIIDAEYLIELQDTLKIQLLIAKRDQIAYDNLNNPTNNTINPNDPTKNGSIVWVGGQYNGTKSGFMTNQPNLGLKVGDKVFIQMKGLVGAEYNGIRTIHSLGTDDGQYTKNMFVIDMPMIAGAQQASGVFQFQEPLSGEDPANSGGGLLKLGVAAGVIKLLTLLA